MNNVIVSILSAQFQSTVRGLLLAALPKTDRSKNVIKPSRQEFLTAQRLPLEFDSHFGQAVEQTDGTIEWSTHANSLIGGQYDRAASNSLRATQAKGFIEASPYKAGQDMKAAYTAAYRARCDAKERSQLEDELFHVEQLDPADVRAALAELDDEQVRLLVAEFAAEQFAYVARFVLSITRRSYRDLPAAHMLTAAPLYDIAEASFASRDTGEFFIPTTIDGNGEGQRRDEVRPDIGHGDAGRPLGDVDDADFDWDAAAESGEYATSGYTLPDADLDMIRSAIQRMRVWHEVVTHPNVKGSSFVDREVEAAARSSKEWMERNTPARGEDQRLRLAS